MTSEEIDAYTRTLLPSSYFVGSHEDSTPHERGYLLDTNRQIIRSFALEEEGIQKTLAHVRSKRAWRFAFDTPLDTCLVHAMYIHCRILEQRGLVRGLPEGDAGVRFIPR